MHSLLPLIHHFHRGLIRALLMASVLCSMHTTANAADFQPISDSTLANTVLRIGDPKTQRALELSGEIKNLPFKVEWANISGGPRTTEAFRSRALDLGAVADIPPIHATWTGLPVKIVAASFRKNPIAHPIYQLGISPRSSINSLHDIRGKKIAYSPGQAQGALILRVLQKAGLTQKDVTLVEMPSTGDVYVSALASGLVDIAPISEANQPRYLQHYGKDGGKLIPHGLRDDAWYLYGLQSVMDDPAKAVAVREYVKAWARATRWVYENPEAWIQGYYINHQGLSAEDGRHLVQSAGQPDIPPNWHDVITHQQATIDLLATETNKPRIDAPTLFDQRYETIAAQALEAP